MDKESLIFISGTAAVLLSFLFLLGYCENLQLECRQFGMQQGLSASDVQAICK